MDIICQNLYPIKHHPSNQHVNFSFEKIPTIKTNEIDNHHTYLP